MSPDRSLAARKVWSPAPPRSRPTPRAAPGALRAPSARGPPDEYLRPPRGPFGRRCRRPLHRAGTLSSRDRSRARGHRGPGHAVLYADELSVQHPSGGPGDREADRGAGSERHEAECRTRRDSRRAQGDRPQSGRPNRRRVATGTAMSSAVVIPDTVYTICWIGLILTLVVFVPLAVYSLHRTWRSARSIQLYAADTLQAAGGIVRNTADIKALDATITVGTDMLGVAGAIEKKLGTVATVLAERAAGRRWCSCR